MSRYMYAILLYGLLLFSAPNCKNHPNAQVPEIVSITFAIDGKSFPISNSFSLRFIGHKDTLVAFVKDTTILLPSLIDSSYDVEFIYSSNRLLFPAVKTVTIVPKQNIKWKFGIQNRPFTVESGLLSKSDIDNDLTTKYLEYWQFDPEEFGDGIQIIEKKQQ